MTAAASESASVAARRRAVVVAGHSGSVELARAALGDPDAPVRVVALGATERLGVLADSDLQRALSDPESSVRRRAAELAATHGDVDLAPALDDADARVVEVAAWACGEHEVARDEVIGKLVALGTGHDDAIVRESAIAALGAIGDERGLPTILTGTTDKPAVRRRAVLALAPFDGDEVDEAIERALEDRDWQVRQAAEDLERVRGG